MSEQIRKVVADFNTSLSTKVEVAGTTFTLSSATDDDSVVLADGDYCFTVNNESSNKEYFVGTLDGSTKIVTAVKTITRQGAESSGAAREHRVGSPVIISDFAGLRDVVETLRGAKNLDASNPVSYDATATISGANMLATKAYVDSVVTGGTVTYDAQILRANAGETVTDGALVYLKESDGEWYLVDTSTKTDWANKKTGIAQGAGTDGASIAGGGVLRSGVDDTISYTAGQLYYGTDVAGVIGTSAGTEELIIGVGDANNKLVFFNDPYQLTDDEKDALAGGGDIGIPSTTNKYVTEDYITAVIEGDILDFNNTTATLGNDATETTVYTETISSSYLGANDGLELEFVGTVECHTTSSGPNVKVKFGSTTIAEFDFETSTNAGNNKTFNFHAKVFIMNNNSVSSQVVLGSATGSIGGLNAAENDGGDDVTVGTLFKAINTTSSFNTSSADFDLTLTYKNDVADNNQVWSHNYVYIKKLTK